MHIVILIHLLYPKRPLKDYIYWGDELTSVTIRTHIFWGDELTCVTIRTYSFRPIRGREIISHKLTDQLTDKLTQNQPLHYEQRLQKQNRKKMTLFHIILFSLSYLFYSIQFFIYLILFHFILLNV